MRFYRIVISNIKCHHDYVRDPDLNLKRLNPACVLFLKDKKIILYFYHCICIIYISHTSLVTKEQKVKCNRVTNEYTGTTYLGNLAG